MGTAKNTLYALLLPLGLFSCQTAKNTAPTASYTFHITVREKYCHAARMDATLVKETEREKPYASQALYFVKKGGTDTLSFVSTVTGECTGKLPAGTYGIYFPEKMTTKRFNNTTRCRNWQATPDTTLTLDPAQPEIRLNLFRGCNPCQPIRQ